MISSSALATAFRYGVRAHFTVGYGMMTGARTFLADFLAFFLAAGFFATFFAIVISFRDMASACRRPCSAREARTGYRRLFNAKMFP